MGAASSRSFAIIPARAGSKGVPDKNVRPLAGKPLMVHAIEAARAAHRIDRIIVSTDSPEYAEIAKSAGAEAPFLRPAVISGDTASDLSVMQHVLAWLAANGGDVPAFLVHLRPTTPIRNPRVIDDAVALIAAHEEATALRSVHEMSETAYKCVERDGEYLVAAFSRAADLEAANRPRQAFPKTYVANGYVDILRTAFIREHGRMHGDRVLGFETPVSPEIDSPADFAYLEFLMGQAKQAAGGGQGGDV